MSVNSVNPLLIRGAEVASKLQDIRCEDGKVVAIADELNPRSGELIVEARGGLLLKGLHDHHIHLFALASRASSILCGPPKITTQDQLATLLSNTSAQGWIRGVGYHESVAGELTTEQLDTWQSDLPVRIQHRSGRVWYLNTVAKKELGLSLHDSNELVRKDAWLRERLPASADVYTELEALSLSLARRGITHLTDATPSNEDATLEILQRHMPYQSIQLMGSMKLSQGPFKILLDDFELLEFNQLVELIHQAHELDRNVAIHCVSHVEATYAIAALEEAGVHEGDRIEHGMVMKKQIIEKVRELDLIVVPNPNFIFERGDVYLQGAESADLEALIPIASLKQEGVRMLGGTDSPFGEPNPWQAMQSAVDRRTISGKTLLPEESVSPEDALSLFSEFGIGPNSGVHQPLKVGEEANLCLLTQKWRQTRNQLAAAKVQATISKGQLTFDLEARN